MPESLQAGEEAELDAIGGKRLFLTVFPSLVLPLFMGVIDQTIVATALPGIVAELGEVERASWVVISYLVANTIAAAVYGRLGDMLGRKRLMFVALGVFIGASALCSLATSIEALTAARLVQGIGGGGLFTLSQALLGETVPPRMRVRYQGYLASIGVMANSFGPLAGGFLSATLGWRSIFWINVPIGIAAIVLTMRLPTRRGSRGSFEFDGLGLVFFTLFIAPTLLVLEQLRQFSSPVLPAAMLIVAAGALALLYRQEKRATMPLFPLGVLGEPTMWRCGFLAACHGAAMVSMITFVPIYLRVVRGTGASDTGALMMPLTLFIPFASMISSRLITLTGRTAAIPSFGLAIPTVTLVILGLFAPHMSLPVFSGVLGIAALGMGTAMTVAQVIVQIVSGPAMLGVAAASVQITRSVGAAFGTATVGAVLFGVLAATDKGSIALFARLIEAGPDALASLVPEAREHLQQAMATAFGWAFSTVACFTAAGMMISWTIPSRRL